MRDVAGAGLLRVVPDGELCGAAGVGTLDRGEQGGELGHPQAVLRDRFGVADARVPPSGAAHPLEHTEFESEVRDGDGVLLIRLLHPCEPSYQAERMSSRLSSPIPAWLPYSSSALS